MAESPPARLAGALPVDRWKKWIAARLPTQRSRRIFLVAVILGAMVIVLLPAISGFVLYRQVVSLAHDGMAHLEDMKARVPSGVDISTVLNTSTLDTMQSDLIAASRDFVQLRNDLNSPIVGLAGIAPGISGRVEAARHLATIGVDATQLGNLVVQSALIAANYVHSSPMTATKPIITQANLDTIQQDLTQAAPLVNDIAAQAQGVSFGSLLTSSQQALLGKVLADLPQIRQDLATGQQFIQVVPAWLGLGKPSTFLLVTMDNSELRATGGFQGNYALVTMQDGHLVNGIKLDDTYDIDEANGQCWNSASVVPPQYSSWWPYGCWGVRDANISPDFPTSAKRTIDLLAQEKNWHVNGVIALTPTLIQQILQLTGPITIGYGYNATVTSQNLEAEIHKYQLNSSYESISDGLPSPDQISSPRKRFTALLGNALQDRLKGASTSLMGGIAKDVIDDIKTKNIQMYFPDPKIERLLSSLSVDASLYRGPNDSLFVVDTNLSGKQSAYLQESFTDQVKLDASGGAAHHLTVTYTFVNPNNDPTYGFQGFQTEYRGWVRIYVPANSQHMSGSSYVDPAYGQHSVDPAASDEPNRAMFAGWVFVPMNAGPVTLTFTWYVPNAVSKGSHYAYVAQRQAGMGDALSVTILGPSSTKPIATYATAKGQVLEKDVTISAP
jgi:hypothetical protein